MSYNLARIKGRGGLAGEGGRGVVAGRGLGG